ncbi:MAG: hypothetical protein SFV52_08365 [Saprospiraceae bacterium]|nr:hypothetical protein [Saprospiraceae bacterium]
MKYKMTPGTADRIVRFFNSVQSAFEIVKGVKDDPGDNETTVFTTRVAKRILEARGKLTSFRFDSVEQIDAIHGVGPDKMEDLMYTFGRPAAEAFESNLFDKGLLLENWTVIRYEYTSETDEAHRALVDDPAAFRKAVHQLATRAAMETRGYGSDEAERITGSVLTDYVDAYTNSTPEAALAFALWFFRVDADNWFSFNRMLTETTWFFDYHSGNYAPMELRLFKGFNNNALLNLITPKDLAITVNDAERVITLWVVGLAD